MEIVEELCSFEGRLAGTDAERRAANRLAERLRGLGRRAEVEPIYVHPQIGLVIALHCGLGFAGSLVAIALPPVGFGLVLLAATSLYLDLNARWYLLRLLLFRRASQNVVSRPQRAAGRAQLVISAHYDAARAGAAFDPKRVRRIARIADWLPFPFAPLRLVFWSLAALLPLLGARMAGVDSGGVAVLQLLPTLVLLVAIFAAVELELSEIVPGANDNASGVAVALSLADALRERAPDTLDVWVVLTGAEECISEGMRAFLRAHRDELDRDSTYFLNLDSVGRGDVRYETAEGLAVSFDLRSRLTEICAAIADADRERENRYRAAAHAHAFATDALPVRLRRYPATTITCLEPGAYLPANYHLPADAPGELDPDALTRAHEFALAVIRGLDRDLGRARKPAAAARV
jgi:hypothetical protein